VYLYRERRKKKFSEKLNMVFVELPKFTKTIEELETNADHWLFMLKNLDKLKTKPSQVRGTIFEKIFKIMKINKLNPEEMEQYKTSILEYNSIKTAVKYAEEKAEEKGVEKKGIQVAKEGLQLGMSVEVVAKLTGFSVAKVKDILQNLKQ
jgi:predicted transposase/invertase (TIGR01784 family)